MAIERPNYDIIPALRAILDSGDSISSIDQLILATRAEKLRIEDEIAQAAQVETQEPTQETNEEEEDFYGLLQEVQEVTTLSRETENTISQLTRDISYLDNAKRNLTESMNLFENLRLLSDSYFECRHRLEKDDFEEMRTPYSVMSKLADTLQGYKSVDEVGKLMARISRLQTETLSRIKKAYHSLIDSKTTRDTRPDERMMREGACELLETNSGAKAEIMDWCLDKLLYDIKEIFQVDDEAGSLENLSRRYVYFKKVLNNFNTDLSQFFPKSWEMPLKLTARFYSATRSDLMVLLDRELQDRPSIDLFMASLQVTMEFEKYIDVKFANRLTNEVGAKKISNCFEPYLVLWISHQENLMNSKILTYMAEDKLSQSSDSLVLPSSADLFRTYRFLLTQTLELVDAGGGRDRMLCELAKFFNTWLKTYSTKKLQPLLLPPGSKVNNRDEATTYTLLVLNTADYCSTTIRQLIEKLSEYLTEERNISGLFDQVELQYGKLVAACMDFLLESIISPDLGFAWREFDNTDWKSVVVEDYSRYMVTMKDILRDEQSIVRKMVSRFNREVFSWNLMDKVIERLTVDFLNCIIKLLKPTPPFANLNKPRSLRMEQVINIGEQLQLDTEFLRQNLNFWADDLASLVNGSSASYKRVRKHIEQNCDDLVKLLKLLVAPVDPAEIYRENYAAITDNNSNLPSWCFILTLKGLPWDLAEWKKLHRTFESAVRPPASEILPIFEKCKPALTEFEYHLSAVTDPTWRKFIHKDLGIKGSPQAKSQESASVKSPASSTQKLQGSKLNGNIKSLMSNTGFFNRGGGG